MSISFSAPNRLLTYCLLFFFATGLSGCLTIEETYEFKRNGSGFMQYVVQLDDLADFLEALQESEEGRDFDLPMEELSLDDLVPDLANVSGISEINLINDQEENRYGINFKFEHLAALNDALNIILVDEQVSTPHTFFSMDNNVIRRTHLMSKNSMAGKFIEQADESEKLRSVLQSMNYKLNFTFAKPIKVVYSVAEATLLGKKHKEVEIEANLKDLIQDTEMLNTSIVLK
ncbi:MAG: hypothetical protein AAFR61_31345 [Bacteroidota bacterium]